MTDDELLGRVLRRFLTGNNEGFGTPYWHLGDSYITLDSSYITLDSAVDVTPEERAAILRVTDGHPTSYEYARRTVR